jgi:hypothetical protein
MMLLKQHYMMSSHDRDIVIRRLTKYWRYFHISLEI